MIVSDPARRDSGTIFKLKHWVHKVIKNTMCCDCL